MTSKREAELIQQLQARDEQLAALEKENALLRQKIDLLIRRLFGAQSEKLDPAQLLLLFARRRRRAGKSPRARGRGGSTALDGPIASTGK